LSLYEEAILKLLKEGPMQRQQIIKQLCPVVMSLKKLQETLNELEDFDKIKAISKRIGGSRRWSTWYALPGDIYLLDMDAGMVVGAIKRLWDVLLRPPTVQEIATETCMIPQDAERLAYKIAAQIGWFPPNLELMKDATEKLGEVLVCAVRIRDGNVSKFNYKRDPETLQEAERFLKNHPEMLPKLSEDGRDVFFWPNETLKYLGIYYKPKDRRFPSRPIARSC